MFGCVRCQSQKVDQRTERLPVALAYGLDTFVLGSPNRLAEPSVVTFWTTGSDSIVQPFSDASTYVYVNKRDMKLHKLGQRIG